MKFTTKTTLFGFISFAAVFFAGQNVALADFDYGGGGGGTVITSSGGGFSGGGSGGSSYMYPTPVVTTPVVTTPVVNATVPVGKVLGASTFNFTKNLRTISRGDDVTELQKVLIAQGFLVGQVPTGYFGNLTRQALVKWQAKNNLPATGYFGPLSRALLNKSNQ